MHVFLCSYYTRTKLYKISFIYLSILGIKIKFPSQMITDLCTFDHTIGYNGKIQLWPIKSRNGDAVTSFLVCLVVLT